MNMLKFGHGVVLDGLPDIPEFHFFLGSGRPQTRFNVVFIFQKSLNVWKDICLEAKHVGTHLIDQLKKMCHLKAENNKLNHSECLLSKILFHCFVCLYKMYFLFILLPHFVLIMYVPIL